MDDDAPDEPKEAQEPSITTAAAWAPLVAEAALARPSAQALARAALLMPRFLGRGPRPSPAPTAAAQRDLESLASPRPAPRAPPVTTQPESVPHPEPPAPRVYPALAAFVAAEGITPVPDAWPVEAPGAPPPQVRAPVRRKAVPADVPQDLLEDLVDSLHIEAGHKGPPQFIVTFREELLGAIRCTLRATPEGLVASLEAHDSHTQRLLEAEAPRLRGRLEERGLKVVAVVVQRAEPDL